MWSINLFSYLSCFYPTVCDRINFLTWPVKPRSSFYSSCSLIPMFFLTPKINESHLAFQILLLLIPLPLLSPPFNRSHCLLLQPHPMLYCCTVTAVMAVLYPTILVRIGHQKAVSHQKAHGKHIGNACSGERAMKAFKEGDVCLNFSTSSLTM